MLDGQVVPPAGWEGQSGQEVAGAGGRGRSVGGGGDVCGPVEGKGGCVWGEVGMGEVGAAGSPQGCWPLCPQTEWREGRIWSEESLLDCAW